MTTMMMMMSATKKVTNTTPHKFPNTKALETKPKEG